MFYSILIIFYQENIRSSQTGITVQIAGGETGHVDITRIIGYDTVGVAGPPGTGPAEPDAVAVGVVFKHDNIAVIETAVTAYGPGHINIPGTISGDPIANIVICAANLPGPVFPAVGTKLGQEDIFTSSRYIAIEVPVGRTGYENIPGSIHRYAISRFGGCRA